MCVCVCVWVDDMGRGGGGGSKLNQYQNLLVNISHGQKARKKTGSL